MFHSLKLAAIAAIWASVWVVAFFAYGISRSTGHRSGDEGSVMGLDRRGCVVQPRPRANRPTGPISDRPEDGLREEPADKAKPFDIPKREVWEAFKRVKANQGAAGVRPTVDRRLRG